MIRHYKDETGEFEVDMKKVAKFAQLMGYKMPVPKDPLDILASELSRAARDEIGHDKETGRPFRVNHAYPVKHGGQTSFFWVDIDEAPRKVISKAFNLRREQMVGDGLQLSYDQDRWNSKNPDEAQIELDFDFGFDIELRTQKMKSPKINHLTFSTEQRRRHLQFRSAALASNPTPALCRPFSHPCSGRGCQAHAQGLRPLSPCPQ